MKSNLQKHYIIFFICLFNHLVAFAAISETEHLRYAVKIDGKNYTEKMVIHYGKEFIKYTSCGDYTDPEIYEPGGYHCWNIVSTSDFKPLTIDYYAGPNKMLMTFTKEGHFTMNGIWDGKKLQKNKIFHSQAYVEITGLVRTMDLNKKFPAAFDLIRITQFPGLKRHCLKFKTLEDVVVDVPAGRFNCKKLLLTPTGYKKFFYKAYFYVTTDKRQLVVKVENVPIGGMSELIEVSF